jgi:serine protease
MTTTRSHHRTLTKRFLSVALLAAIATSGMATRAHAADELTGGELTGGDEPSVASAEVVARRVAKPETTKFQTGRSRTALHVKFVEGTDIRLRGGRFTTTTGERVAPLDQVLAAHPRTRVSPLFAASEQDLTTVQQTREAASGKALADLNLYFSISTPESETIAVVDALNELDIVETAYLAPTPVQPAADFSGYQGYFSPASSSGIDANYANTLTGGKGEYVRVVDVEYSWNRNHEDLSKLRAAGSAIANGSACDTFNNTDHGTAVIGEIAADANGTGVTGLAPGAWIGTANASRWATNASGQSYCAWDMAGAIYAASRQMSRGDVLLIEQQVAGPYAVGGTSQVGLVAAEWIPANYDAIASATAAGIIVVEAAGNGSQNLNNAAYGTVFPSNKPDSGAIVVGAGAAAGCTSPARGRLSFSNYGSRVDVQAWGECVATTGYGNLQGGSLNQYYTASFGGTSSASPIVASAAAILSSIAESRGVVVTPRDMRTLLKSTGTAQQAGLAGNIGPLPNLRAAIAALPGTTTGSAPTVSAPTHELITATTVGTTLPVRVRWTASDSDGIAATTLSMRVNSGAWVNQTLASTTSSSKTLFLTRGARYEFAVQAQDSKGNWSAWSYGSAFRGDSYEENQYATYGPAANWTRTAWAPASGGNLTLASVRGSTATFSFTGRSVAWVGTRATNRGQASIYIDGVFKQTIDLYSATTLAQQSIIAYAWPTSGTHTIQVVVEGTTGRPKIDIDAFVRLT